MHQTAECQHLQKRNELQDLLVMYRQTQSSPSKFVKLRQRILGPNEQESTPKYQQRNSINMRIYRDIPVPSWKIVFPNKLLQFRPLDGLRSDLLSIAGLLCECCMRCLSLVLPALRCCCDQFICSEAEPMHDQGCQTHQSVSAVQGPT